MRWFSLGRTLGAVCLCLMVVSSASAQTLDSTSQEWMDKDAAEGCDAIGWNVMDAADYGLYDRERWASCIDGRSTEAICGTFSGTSMFSPPRNSTWIVCALIIKNMSSGTVTVSMLDYSLVDANGRKYDYDVNVHASLGSTMMLGTETLRQGQYVEGFVGFSIPTSAPTPLFIEVAPLTTFSDDAGYIVIPTLPSIDVMFR